MIIKSLQLLEPAAPLEKEQKEILSAINNKEIEIIILTGPFGVGKRTLMSNVLSKENSNITDNEKFQKIIWIDYPKFQSEKIKRIMEGNFELFTEFLTKLNCIIVINQIFQCTEGIISPDEIDEISFFMSELNKAPENNEMSSDPEVEIKDLVGLLIKKILEKEDADSDKGYKAKKPKLILISSNKSFLKYIESFFNQHEIRKSIKSIKLSGLDLSEINTLMDSKFSQELIEALYFQTKGNPGIIECIKLIDEAKLNEITQLPPEEASLGLILLAQKMMEERLNN